MDGRIDTHVWECRSIARDGWIYVWVGVWMSGWINGWMNGCIGG